ncbi:uncharacterized protein LOC105429029 [Pogonomyrmex barbatus]|uniref:Uncharacterized protein LOC105429029 n=1 Tax=Pogonomyrmex barbatus TaxID=144034 RepID=A0A6I9X6G6_9HYME|nr:uncharacterized protein LOC105429029 [Pogonomyrmex barbatus]
MNLYSTLHHICQGLNSLTTLLLIVFGLYHTEKFKHCLKKLAIIDVTLKSLGTTINNQQLYIKIIWLVLGWFMSVVLINCIHSLYIISQHNYDIVTVICISIILNHCSHINLIEDIMVASILGLVFCIYEYNFIHIWIN